jgi:cellulose synthase/poly-beta-1,6-N-acetylglucosamine synthase-like glycosyltransferase
MDVLKWMGYVVFGLYALTSLWLLANGLVQLHLLWHYKRKKYRETDQPGEHELPFVSIQVPVYNEKFVIGDLLGSLARLDYPRHLFEIQILDDSTDETSMLIDQHAVALSNLGCQVSVIRRGNRTHYKAGALQHGLAFCKGSLIAIFDADFQPAPDFIRRLLPQFSRPEVGMVQASWAHRNRNENYLTRIQTFLLDAHFSVEQSGRSNAGYFINFCGTAGIWRKQCIEDAGGWDGSVLSEDLDLSYRAQLRGWKLKYDEQTEVPAELPPVMQDFKVQQFRWTKGMAQTFRKTAKAVLHSSCSAVKKFNAIFHLLGSFVFVCLFINALLTLPLLYLRNAYLEFEMLTRLTVLNCLNLLALVLFYYQGNKSKDKESTSGFWKHLPLFLVVYMGLAVQNSIAVLQGLFGFSSPFIRTPKASAANKQGDNDAYAGSGFSWVTWLEIAVFIYFLFGIALSFYYADYFMLLFFVMISYGIGLVAFESIWPSLQQRWKRRQFVFDLNWAREGR